MVKNGEEAAKMLLAILIGGGVLKDIPCKKGASLQTEDTWSNPHPTGKSASSVEPTPKTKLKITKEFFRTRTLVIFCSKLHSIIFFYLPKSSLIKLVSLL